MNDETNVFNLVNGGKSKSEQEFPTNTYEITDVEGNVYEDEGFLIFTSQHVAVMRDEGKGAIPVLVVPMSRLVAVEAID